MFKVKFSNDEIMSFLSKDDILYYVSENWGVQTYQIVIIGNKNIFLTNKLGSVFAAIGTIELE